MRQQLLPDPFMDVQPFTLAGSANVASFVLGTWSGAANRAIYLPQIFPVRCRIYELRIVGGNATGNYDLGVYDANGVLLASKGSTALAAAIQTLSLDLSVPAGTLLYAALALSSTSGSTGRIVYTSGAFQTVAAGMMMEASALPLPSTMTPVASAELEIPIFAWGIR